ncbi:hypothetical protein Dimus_024794 [Dionaea muscipula]
MLVAVGETQKRLRSVALSLVNTIKANPDFLSDIETPAIQILESWKDKRGVIFCDEARKPPAGNSWLGSLIATIIGNLKISISNIHV